mgnify:CR=1 FL=1
MRNKYELALVLNPNLDDEGKTAEVAKIQATLERFGYLTFADRKQISAWYQSNDRAADIAERLGMSVKTIYLELKRGEETDESGAVILDRNQRPAYNPVLAQQRLQANFKRRGRVAVEEAAERAGA